MKEEGVESEAGVANSHWLTATCKVKVVTPSSLRFMIRAPWSAIVMGCVV